ncbi:MAG: hypothetical protein RMK99_15610, partial [Anaerolineales bacterium]|nr:hypothetical protein [Anaerolineales bacterium]
RWGLAGYDSPNPGGVGDALANGYLLALAARSTGGDLRGIAVWNYNVRGQGLYGDADPAPYDRETLFARVSGSFAEWRRLMAAPGGRARVLLLLTDRAAHTYLGETRNAVRDSPVHFDSLLPFTRLNTPAAVVGALPALDDIEAILVLDPTPQTLATSELATLRTFANNGGQLFASAAVLKDLRPATRPAGIIPLPASPYKMTASDWAGLFPGATGIHVSGGGRSLFYAPAEAAALPGSINWQVFDHNGQPRMNAIELRAHEFALSP